RLSLSLFLFPGTPITEIYALSLHDALPIFEAAPVVVADDRRALAALRPVTAGHVLVAGHERRAVGLRAGENVVLVGTIAACLDRSEEHTSELQSRENLVCRLLLEKKNQRQT